jgi:hypothetical protein
MLFDRSWGSAGYSLRWRGREFINASDQGRLLQFALFYWDPQLFDPTEGGDGSGHGSPVLEVTAGGNSLHTRTQPLIWNGQLHAGGDYGSHDPVLWGGQFGKTVTILDSLQPDFVPVCWRTEVKPWKPINPSMGSGDTTPKMEWITAYTPISTSENLHTWTKAKHDITGDGFTSLDWPEHEDSGGGPMPALSAIVVSTSDNHYAMGIITRKAMMGEWFNFDGYGGSATRKMRWEERPVTLGGGSWNNQEFVVFVADISNTYAASSAIASFLTNLGEASCMSVAGP